MTTLIDDGLVERCWDDSNSLKDIEQITIIDVDDIDATIEDPVNILDDTPDMFNKNEEFTSSYKKRSFALPVSFFDINRNISLLKKCRPISIKIVDCDIYPWYYKKVKHVIKKQDVENNECVNIVDDDSVVDVEEEKATLEEQEDCIKTYQTPLFNSNKITPECNFNKNVEPYDLLTYKAIAQTIVHNIDYSEFKSKTDNVSECVQSSKINITSDDVMLIGVENTDRSKVVSQRGEGEKNITSPILPYSIKPPKKSKPKQKISRKSTKANANLEKCSDPNKNCDKFMTSINQIIPHYHCRLPLPANTANSFHFPSMVTNSMHSQGPISMDAPLHVRPPMNKSNNVFDSYSPYNSQRRLLIPPNSFGDPLYLDYNSKSCHNTVVSSTHVTNQQYVENVNPNINKHTPAHQFPYPNSLSYLNSYHAALQHTNEIKANKLNNLRQVRPTGLKQIRTENCPTFTQSSTVTKNVYDNCISNALSTSNEYVNYCKTQTLLPRTASNMTDIINTNPLLSQLLNFSSLDNCSSSPSGQYGGVYSRPAVEKTSYSSVAPNCWLPPRVSLPSYEDHMASMQCNSVKTFPYPNAEMQFRSLPSLENTNILQNKTNLHLTHLDELAKVISSINLPNVSNSVPFTNNSTKRNICSHTEVQNKNQDPSKLSKTVGPKAINTANAENTNKVLHFNTYSSKIENKIMPNEYDVNALKNIPGNNKVDCSYSKVDKTGIISPLKKNIFNPIEKDGIPDPHHYDAKARTDVASKINDITLQPTKGIDIVTSERVDSNIIGYSPPILPIPSFKKSLEMLSELQQTRTPNAMETINLVQEINKGDTSKQNGKYDDYSKIIRKRKLNIDENNYNNSKRISLQQYKIRRSENGVIMT